MGMREKNGGKKRDDKARRSTRLLFPGETSRTRSTDGTVTRRSRPPRSRCAAGVARPVTYIMSSSRIGFAAAQLRNALIDSHAHAIGCYRTRY